MLFNILTRSSIITTDISKQCNNKQYSEISTTVVEYENSYGVTHCANTIEGFAYIHSWRK